jgi:hypothetical protein
VKFKKSNIRYALWPAVLSVLMLCLDLSTLAQPFGNEWISYDQQYWKIKVAQTGLYRISYSDLANGGFPVSAVQPQQIQIFGRGRECPILVSGESDGVFNPQDFIEFYGQKNDAWLDSAIYQNALYVPNPSYSLYNDTATYFITIGSQPGLRMAQSTQTSFSDYSPLTYCIHTSDMDFHNEYLIGKQDINGISLPLMEQAEGWFDFKFPKGASHEKFIPTSGTYSGPDAPPVFQPVHLLLQVIQIITFRLDGAIRWLLLLILHSTDIN